MASVQKSQSRPVKAMQDVIKQASMPAESPVEVISGIESQLRDLESRCHTLRESFNNLSRQLWPISDMHSPATEYGSYVGCDSKSEKSVGSVAPYESRMQDISNEMAALEYCLDDLRMRLRV